MRNLYDLLSVKEDASKEKILNEYNRIIEKEQDEKKKNALKIAVDILLDDEKRKRYNEDLNKMRAEELIKKVETQNEKTNIEEPKVSSRTDYKDKNESNEYNEKIEAAILEEAKRQLEEKKQEELKVKSENKNIISNNNLKSEFEKIEEKEYMKAVKKEEKLRKKEIKKAKIEYQDAYAEAYHEELKRLGYDVKAPWTRKRIKSAIISTIVFIILILIIIKVPFFRKIFEDLYYSNFIIKSVVDIFASIINAIKTTFIK